jgi:heme-degrading monooxygenase HmoA
MIARIWHGKTAASQMEAYSEFLTRMAIPDYRSTQGFQGLTFLRRVEGDEAHFDLITYWESMNAIRNFAGEDPDKAKYYPEDKTFLLEFEENVRHFEVFAIDQTPSGS